MRRARKTDANHAQIRNLLRALCCVVEDLSDVGRGVPDLLVRTPRRSIFVVEVKDGAKPPSQQRLSDDEQAFARRWGDSYVVVKNEAEAVALARR